MQNAFLNCPFCKKSGKKFPVLFMTGERFKTEKLCKKRWNNFSGNKFSSKNILFYYHHFLFDRCHRDFNYKFLFPSLINRVFSLYKLLFLPSNLLNAPSTKNKTKIIYSYSRHANFSARLIKSPNITFLSFLKMAAIDYCLELLFNSSVLFERSIFISCLTDKLSFSYETWLDYYLV